MALAVLVVVVAAWVGRAQNKQESAPEDLVEVLVAAKNLPVGTYFDRDNLSTMVTRKKVPRLSLPPAYVIDEAILLDKRLLRDLAAGKMLTPAMVAKGVLMPLRDEDDLSTLAYRTHDANGRLITPGSNYDVIATVGTPNGEVQTFTLLVNMLVLAVDAIPNLDENRPQPGKASVSLRATQRQAMIIALAKIKGCRIIGKAQYGTG